MPGAKQPGFLIYLPVYQGGVDPGTVELRREKIVGFVYCPFDPVTSWPDLAMTTRH